MSTAMILTAMHAAAGRRTPAPAGLGAGREWRRVAVYGLGLSGTAAALLLRRHGVTVVGLDSRPAAALDLGELATDPRIDLVTGAEPERLPDGVDALVLSPGVPPDRLLVADARRRGVPVVAEVELAFPLLNGPVAAITGSNGKSTTTALTGAILRTAGIATEVCGNIGAPLSGRVEGAPGRAFVVELSSFQLEATDTFHPRAAALLNLAPDHLDRYRGLDEYLATKRRIFLRQTPGDVAVLNADDPASAASPTAARRRLFTRRAAVADGCFLRAGRVIEADPGENERELFARADLPLAGEHNLENAMAAALVARALGAVPEAVRAGVRAFTGLPHRMQLVAESGGIAWYDDSKGTNAAATARSLEGLPGGRVHLILGGRAKGEDPGALRAEVAAKARRVYLIGEAAGDFERGLAGAAPLERAGTLERAVAAAAERAEPGDVVLLSPACASFDQFRSYAHRGEEFRRLVAAILDPAAAAEGRHGQEEGG
jgi:UDP-N-acetylmuramoylalanine--D-glutamate ligase